MGRRGRACAWRRVAHGYYRRSALVLDRGGSGGLARRDCVSATMARRRVARDRRTRGSGRHGQTQRHLDESSVLALAALNDECAARDAADSRIPQRSSRRPGRRQVGSDRSCGMLSKRHRLRESGDENRKADRRHSGGRAMVAGRGLATLFRGSHRSRSDPGRDAKAFDVAGGDGGGGCVPLRITKSSRRPFAMQFGA